MRISAAAVRRRKVELGIGVIPPTDRPTVTRCLLSAFSCKILFYGSFNANDVINILSCSMRSASDVTTATAIQAHSRGKTHTHTHHGREMTTRPTRNYLNEIDLIGHE